MSRKIMRKFFIALLSFCVVIGCIFPVAIYADDTEIESQIKDTSEDIEVESDMILDEEVEIDTAFGEDIAEETYEGIAYDLDNTDSYEVEATLPSEIVDDGIEAEEETNELNEDIVINKNSDEIIIADVDEPVSDETIADIEEYDETTSAVNGQNEKKTKSTIKKAAASGNISAKNLSATDADANTKIIQAVLDKAKTATASKPVTVTIPAGTWPIRMLKLYSNTEIVLNGTLKRAYANSSDTKPMLYTMDDNNNRKGGYGRAENIKISGGTWDSNSSGKSYNSNVMHFAHSKNITIENTTIQNCGASHAIILDGIKDAVINNVKFNRCNGVDADGSEKFVSETIHIDSCSSELHAGSAEPFDHTNCQNIKVTNNTFTDVTTAVGAHKHKDKVTKQDIHNNIIISGNTFNKVAETCINGVRINNLTVSGNKAKNSAKLFIRLHAATNFKVTNNNVDGVDRFAYSYITDDLKEISNGSFSGNTVKNISGKEVADKNGVVFQANGFKGNFSFENENYSIDKSQKYSVYINGSNATIKNSKMTGGAGVRLSSGKFVFTGNTVSKTKGYSLFIDKAPNSGVENNAFSECDADSFILLFLDGTNKCSIKNNTISNAKAGGIYFRSASNNTFTGNYVTGMKSGKLPVYLAKNANNNKITDNFFTGVKDAWAATDCKGNTIKNNIFMFSDVTDKSQYYFAPVYWAAKKGITNGYSNGTFGPKKNCTRAQIVTFLWRLAGKPNPKTKKNPFKDLKSNDYYYKAVLWAAEKGITNGYSDGTFRPNATCLREHVVTFLWRYAGKPSPKTTKNPFKDIKKNDYYYKAVLWANEKGIAKGYNSGAHKGGFGPKLDCQREHVVTFLYRYAK